MTIKDRPISSALAATAIVLTVFAISDVIAKTAMHRRVVQVTAQRFHYTPEEITLKKGEPVVIEFTSLDFTHGFKVPDLGIRADLPPGKITKVRLTPKKAGTFIFLCDNFCGTGHEDMNGRIVVTE